MSSPTICKAPGTLSISADRAGASPRYGDGSKISGKTPQIPVDPGFIMIFPSADGMFFLVKSIIFRSDWRITPASTTRGLLFGFVRTLALSPPFLWLSQGILPCIFFSCPNFCANFPHLCVVNRGEIPHQVLLIHVMDHGPWTPVQQHSGAAYLMLLRSTLAWHLGGDVERAGRKK